MASAKKVGGVVAGVATVGVGLFAALQTPSCPATMACLSWQASETWTNGTRYAAGTVVTYRVYRGYAANKVDEFIGTTTELSMNVPNNRYRTETQYFNVIAEVEGFLSNPSNTANKLVRAPGPTDGRIEAPSDGAIE